MIDKPSNRLVYIDQHGDPQCVSAKAVLDAHELHDALSALAADMELALDCIRTFGGVPLPVARAILRNIEPAHAAIDMAIRCSPPKEASLCP